MLVRLYQVETICPDHDQGPDVQLHFNDCAVSDTGGKVDAIVVLKVRLERLYLLP